MLGPRESAHINQCIAAYRHRIVIAASLTFSTNTPGYPPRGRMEEKQILDDSLKQVHHAIMPPDVCKFVSYQRIQHRTVDCVQNAFGQQNQGPEPPGHRRDGVAGLEPRQHTLRATLDWSYGLLNAEEQRWLRSMAVFSGGWTLEAAAAVAHAGTHEVSVIDWPGLLAKLAKSADRGGHANGALADVANDLSYLVGVRERVKLPPRDRGPRALTVINNTVSAIMTMELVASIYLDWSLGHRVRGDAARSRPEHHRRLGRRRRARTTRRATGDPALRRRAHRCGPAGRVDPAAVNRLLGLRHVRAPRRPRRLHPRGAALLLRRPVGGQPGKNRRPTGLFHHVQDTRDSGKA